MPKKPKYCAGFPREGSCKNIVDESISPLWCPDCEKKRLAHLDKRFAEIAKSFGIVEGK